MLPLAALAQPSAQQLFERTRPSVVEIVTQTRGNGGIASTASGFLAHRNDWVVTNYHAVSEVIFEPDENELLVETHSRQRVSARVVAADVRRDLAILKLVSPVQAPVLQIRPELPSKGEPGYSIGKPGQYKHNIVTGTFNGLVEEDAAPLLVFSGPINRGMSGGPALNSQGWVVGVNVATSTENQLLGFLVPASALLELIQTTNRRPNESNEVLMQNIAQQFAEHGRRQQLQLLKIRHAQRQLGPFKVQGDLSEEEECRTAYSKPAKLNYKQLQQTCESSSGLYINHGLYAGKMITGAFWIDGKELSDFALSRVVERRLNIMKKVHEEDSPTGRWYCSEQRLLTSGQILIQLHACKRPIEKLPGLSDYRFRYTPLIKGKDSLVVAVGLHGYDDSTAQTAIATSILSLVIAKDSTP